jgi:hypothetical protein
MGGTRYIKGTSPNSLFKTNNKKQENEMSERRDIRELLEIAEENNRILRSILTIVTHEHSSDFTNNVIANLLGNIIMPGRR